MAKTHALLTAGLVAGSLGLVSGQAVAAAMSDAEAAEMYMNDHMAIRAVELCRGIKFDQAAYMRMEAKLRQEIGRPIGPNQLFLLEDGQDKAWDMVQKYGCKSPQVAPLLVSYDEAVMEADKMESEKMK